MYKLIYSAICFNKPAKCKLANMLRAASISNRQGTVTGCITEYENGYLHYVEGPKDAVQNAFLEISSCPEQHTTIIYSADSLERSFNRHHVVGIELVNELNQQKNQQVKQTPLEQIDAVAYKQDISVKFFGVLVKETLWASIIVHSLLEVIFECII